MNLIFSIDIINNRVVYANDLHVGVRGITLDKGTTYICPVTFYSGLNGVSLAVSGFSCNLSAPNNRNNPLVSTVDYADNAFNLPVYSTILDFAINGKDSLNLITDINFSGNGVFYNIADLPTVINNNNSVAPTSSDLAAAVAELQAWRNSNNFLVLD